MVVLPTPGGPHRISEDSRPAAAMRPIGPSGPSKCAGPTPSSSRRGRSRSASGRGAEGSSPAASNRSAIVMAWQAARPKSSAGEEPRRPPPVQPARPSRSSARVEEEGFTLILTPAQLAAAISGGTLDGEAPVSNWTRATGGAKLLFGGLEELGAGALLLTPEPTMATKVGGVALGLHGADTLQSGGRQLWTGRETRTLTSEGTAALAAALGVDEATAARIGEGVDLAVPIALSLGLGALRVAAVRGGRVVLAEHEAVTLRGVGGHTILKHVAQTDAQLAARLAAQARIPAASTFVSLVEAETAVSAVMRTQRAAIAAWARTAPAGARQAFTMAAPGAGVGRVLSRGAASPVAGRVIRMVLKKEAYNGKLYYILTAFPEP